jgi:hypothetical protein
MPTQDARKNWNGSRYLVLDERAMDDPDDALILDTGDDLADAREGARDHAPCVIWDTKRNEMVEYVSVPKMRKGK